MLRSFCHPSVRTNHLLQFAPIHLVDVSVTQVDFVAHHKKMISRKHHMKGVVGEVDVVVLLFLDFSVDDSLQLWNQHHMSRYIWRTWQIFFHENDHKRNIYLLLQLLDELLLVISLRRRKTEMFSGCLNLAPKVNEEPNPNALISRQWYSL